MPSMCLAHFFHQSAQFVVLSAPSVVMLAMAANCCRRGCLACGSDGSTPLLLECTLSLWSCSCKWNLVGNAGVVGASSQKADRETGGSILWGCYCCHCRDAPWVGWGRNLWDAQCCWQFDHLNSPLVSTVQDWRQSRCTWWHWIGCVWRLEPQ
jgi:hypothetical protein